MDHYLPGPEAVLSGGCRISAGSLKFVIQLDADQTREKTVVSVDRIRAAIQPLRQALLLHPIYHDMRGPQALRTFMEHHVFAVWDFMSLIKALQQRLCCVSVPWVPSPSPEASRFINEIVLAEESDEDGHGG